ncbi:Pikachurin [Fasciola hepatica]|uniref:Pikachurin n=1 Tax=Fasciola hepatica TaxID=6192 RepID=A0A4E0RWE2_FASHE|nr:Pikachurin [Fasciola hepatica]
MMRLAIVLAIVMIQPFQLSTSQDSDWSMVMEVEVEDPSQPRNESKADSFRGTEEDHHVSRNSQDSVIYLNSNRCGSLICYNGARCFPPIKRTGFKKCLCQMGFLGDNCEIANQEFRFPKIEEGGYLKFLHPQSHHQKDLSNRELIVEFDLKPSLLEDHSLLAYHLNVITGDKNILTYEDDHLVYRKIFGAQLLQTDKQPFNMSELRHNCSLRSVRSQWYHVSFGHTAGGNLFLSVNENRQELPTVLFKNLFVQYHRAADASLNELYIGGHPELEQLKQDVHLGKYLQKNYVGCIHHIRVQGKRLDPRRKSFVGDAVEGFGITDCAKDVCSESPCQNNGTCRPASGSTYECLCPFGVTGLSCNARVAVHLPAYSGNSFSVYRGLRGTSRSQSSILMVFMPRSSEGLLLYQGLSTDKRGDFVAILMTNGHLVVVWDLGSGHAHLRSPTKLALDVWHTVEFWHIGREGFVRLNLSPEIQSAFTVGELVQLTLGQDLYLGGHPDMDLLAASLTKWDIGKNEYQLVGFQGCIQELVLNGIPVRMVEQILYSANLNNCQQHACSSPTSACSNRGTCVPKTSSHQCSCLLGYTGSFCEEKLLLDKTAQVSFDGNGYLEFSSRPFLNIINIPHFDIYMDIKTHSEADSSKTGDISHLPKDQNLLTLGDYATLEKRFLMIKITARGQLTLSWLRYTSHSEFIVNVLSENRTTFESRGLASKQKVEPGHWQKLMLKRRSNDFLLYLNGSQIDSVNGSGSAVPVFNKLLIGGLDSYIPLFPDDFVGINSQQLLVTPTSPMDRKSTGFRGCVGNIHINGRRVMAGDAQSGRNVNACPGVT